MTKENQHTTTGPPEGSTAYAFGSWASRGLGRDADILIVYDPTMCEPCNAYDYHSGFISKLESVINLPIDLSLLTIVEEAQIGFIVHENCIPLEAAIKQRCEQGGALQPPTRPERELD